MSGDRGLISYFEKKQILNNLQQNELQLINKINNLDLKNSLLLLSLDLIQSGFFLIGLIGFFTFSGCRGLIFCVIIFNYINCLIFFSKYKSFSN